MQRMPSTIPVNEIEAAIAQLGGHYPSGEVRRFHAALNFLSHKHFVILSGLSGTGKTQLALKYARAIHGLTNFMKTFLPGYSLATNSGTDGSIRAMIASRFPIARSTKWLNLSATAHASCGH